VAGARAKYGISERWACRLLRQWRGTQRYKPLQRVDEDALGSAVALVKSGGTTRYIYTPLGTLDGYASSAVNTM
jgi:hypothetical protein